jgi:multiple sugar transport system substrate-binding protein
LVAASSALLAACGQQAATASAPVQPTPARRMSAYTVRLYTWGTAADRQLYETIGGDIARVHDDVRLAVELRETSGHDDHAYYARLSASIADGTVADLVHARGATWQEFAARGSLHPLNELAPRDRWTLPWPNEESYELQTRFRGKRYLSPSTAGPLVMYVAKDHFKQAAVAVPRADWTYAEFQDVARRLTRQAAGAQVYGYQWTAGYLRNVPWWRMNGAQEWDRAAEPRRAAWTGAAVVEAFKYQLYDSQYKLRISPTHELLEANPGSYRIESGGVAMKVEGPWLLQRQRIRKADDAGSRPELEVQLLPTGKSGRKVHVNLLEGQAITKNSKDRDAAWEVLKWIGGEEGQRRMAEAGKLCNVPETIRKYGHWVVGAAGQPAVEVFAKAIEGSTYGLAGEIGESELDREAQLSAALNSIRDGRAPVKEVLETLQPRIQQTLDSFWAAHAAGR